MRVDVPDDASADAHREWLLVQTRSPWKVGGTTLSGRRAAGHATSTTSWPASAISPCCSSRTRTPRWPSYAWTRHHLILDVLDDVKSRLEVLTPPAGDGDVADARPCPAHRR